MMDIDFIKWMCEKSEGFDWKDGQFQTPYNEWYKLHKNRGWFDIMIYPLLLQRAIEGINLKDESIMINQRYSCIVIRQRYEHDERFKLVDNPDKAKESALKYIYEQETK